MIEKHLKRIKEAESGISEEDEWKEIPNLGQKIDDQILEEVPDRTVRVERFHKKNLDAYEEDAPKIKDQFNNTAQYAKLIKKHVEEKNIEFNKFKKDKERFDKEISILKPRKREIKFNLDKFDYKEVKISKLNQELTNLESEREEIKNKIIHFNNQITQTQTELSFKVEQIDEIKQELARLEKKEALQHKIKTEQEAIEVIKNELSSVGDLNESKRIFRTVNTLVDLLNEKNQVTVKELDSVKTKFNKLKMKYDELMSKLR